MGAFCLPFTRNVFVMLSAGGTFGSETLHSTACAEPLGEALSLGNVLGTTFQGQSP